MRILKILLLASCIFLGFSSCQEFDNYVEQYSKRLTPEYRDSVRNFFDPNPLVDYEAQYKYGREALIKHISENIESHSSIEIKNLLGNATVKFMVLSNGTTGHYQILENPGGWSSIEVTRILKEIDLWIPARLEEKNVNSWYTVSVPIYVEKDETAESESSDENSEPDPPNEVEEKMPEFPGGFEELSKFLTENIVYPEYALSENITGKVYVKFLVTNHGHVDKVSIAKGIGGGCDLESARVIKMTPKWEPGYQDGKPVNVWYTLPINFALE